MENFKMILQSCWSFLNTCVIDFGNYSFSLFQLLVLVAILSIAGYMIWGLLKK